MPILHTEKLRFTKVKYTAQVHAAKQSQDSNPGSKAPFSATVGYFACPSLPWMLHTLEGHNEKAVTFFWIVPQEKKKYVFCFFLIGL